MIIKISDKHVVEKLATPIIIKDSEIPEGEVFQYLMYSTYITMCQENKIAYISITNITSFVKGSLSNQNKVFPKGTVITLTQNYI